MLLTLWYVFFFFFFKQKTAYEMRISDWSSDVCSSDLAHADGRLGDARRIMPFETRHQGTHLLKRRSLAAIIDVASVASPPPLLGQGREGSVENRHGSRDHQRAHAVRIVRRKAERDRAAPAVADEVRALDPERVHEPDHHSGMVGPHRPLDRKSTRLNSSH